MYLPPSLHYEAEPVVVLGKRLIINSREMFPYRTYKFEFLGVKMVAMLNLNPDRVDIYEEEINVITNKFIK